MAIRFSCACGKEMQAQDEYAGRKTKCPACGAEVRIPGRSTQVQEPPAVIAEPSARGRRPARERAREEDDDFDDRRSRPRETKTSGLAIFSLVMGLISFCLPVIGSVFGVMFGFLGLRAVAQGDGRVTGKGLAITGMLLSVAGLVCSLGGSVGGFFLVNRIRQDTARRTSANNLRQIGLALSYYESSMNSFPPPYFRDPPNLPGAPNPPGRQSGLSWRVAILPYIEQDSLYRQFHLDEPWDSPHNKTLLTRMPAVYAHPNADSAKTAAGFTHYRAFVGPGTLFDPTLNRGVRIADIFDGTSFTIAVVEAADPIEWTRPDDLNFDPNALLPKLGLIDDGFNVLFADGSVRFIKKPVDEKMIKAAITRNGGEPVFLP